MKISNCPICGLQFFEPVDEMELRNSYEICPFCGCEYGNDDNAYYRERWLAGGAQWFHPSERPENWNLNEQLARSDANWNR